MLSSHVPATQAQWALIASLTDANPAWTELPDGSVWETIFDVTCDGSKFVSTEEAAAAIAALEALS